MSRLNNFLNESIRTTLLTEDETINLLKTKCSNSLKYCIDNDDYIYRGLTNSNPRLLTDTSKGKLRKSTTFNYYNLLLDNLESWKNYPKRQKSIICTTNFSYSKTFGLESFIVFPFNNINIGVCPENDIWHSFRSTSLIYFGDELNEILNIILGSKSEKFDKDWKTFNKAIKDSEKIIKDSDKTINNEYYSNRLIWKEIFIKKRKYLEVFNEFFNPNKNRFKLMNSNKLKLKGNLSSEIWFSGKAVLINKFEFFENFFYRLG